MATIVHDDLWLCVDCTIAKCNGDYSGMSDERAEQVGAAFDKFARDNPGLHLAPNWHSADDTGEIEDDGHRDFAWKDCDICHSGLGGEFHRFATLK